LIGSSFSGDRAALGLSENLDSTSRKPLITALGLHTRFPKEHKVWESSETEIERRFREILSQRKMGIHANIVKDVRDEVKEVVVSKLFNLFP
jgi:hypothetical protein